MTELKIEMSTAASSSTRNPAAEREAFLEEYGRNMNRLCVASEGFIALHELLSSDATRDVHLSDLGREGLAVILKMLGDEAMDALGSLPAVWEMKRLLQEGPRHE